MIFYALDSKIAGTLYMQMCVCPHARVRVRACVYAFALTCCLRLMMSQTPWTYVESVCLKKSRFV
jgi:hypothetical protein